MEFLSSFSRRPPIFEEITAEEWSSWHWQQQNRLRKWSDFEDLFEFSEEEREHFEALTGRFHVAITPHYASLMERRNPVCPIRLQGLPHKSELITYDFERVDPLGEEAHMPVPGLTHRYPDRVLLYASHNCPVYCRHCTRKRKVADPTTAASRSQLEAGLDYIRRTESVRDVVISGGDPLTLSDQRLEELLSTLRSIDHLDAIRIGTRNPVTLPQRITPEFAEMLSRFAPIYIHTHFNHPAEISKESAQALRLLLKAGCVLGNQMVLLRGVNDDAQVVLDLNRRLLRLGCRPYYMLQCDMSEGITHFRTPIEKGLEIMNYLRGRIGGMGVPDFVVDLPGGGGKIELVPEYLIEKKDNDDGSRELLFRNFKGDLFRFYDVPAGE